MAWSDLTNLWSGARRRRELYRDGMAALHRKDYSAAVAALGQITEDDHLHGRLARFYLGEAHRRLGLAALEQADYAAASVHLQSACRLNPSGGELARILAVTFVRDDNYPAALAPLERAVACDREDLKARVMLALAQWRSGQADQAELTLHQGLGGDPTAEPAVLNFYLGLLAAQTQRWDRVEHYLSRCLAVDENDPQALRYLGLAQAAQDRPAEALATLRQAQRLAPADPHIALEMTFAAAAAGHGPLQMRQLKLASLTASRPVEEQGEDLDRLARAIVAEPEFIQAFLDLPDSQMDQQIFGVLGYSLKRALLARPGYADLHYYISKVNSRLGRLGDAIDSAEQAIALNPRYVAALIHAAGLYHQTAQRGAAADRLRAAIAAGGDYPDVHLLLGHLYRDLGQTGRARRSYERALKLNPDYRAAREALSALAA